MSRLQIKYTYKFLPFGNRNDLTTRHGVLLGTGAIRCETSVGRRAGPGLRNSLRSDLYPRRSSTCSRHHPIVTFINTKHVFGFELDFCNYYALQALGIPGQEGTTDEYSDWSVTYSDG